MIWPILVGVAASVGVFPVLRIGARNRLTPLRRAGRIAQAFRVALAGDERAQQLAELDTGLSDEIKAMRRHNRRNLYVSAGAVAVAATGTFVPALSLVSALAVLWLMRPIFGHCLKDLRRWRISTFVIDSIFILGVLAMGYVFLAALIGFLANISIKLLKSTERLSRQKLVSVFDMRGIAVWVEREGSEIEIPFEQVSAGDIVVVGAGEVIPVDGAIVGGEALVDQHMLTGEMQPADKVVGDRVLAATMVQSGRLRIRVDAAAAESTAAQIAAILNNTASYTSGLTARGQQISDDLVVPSLGLSGAAWLLLGPAPALAVLYVPLGVDMRLTGPLTVLNYLQVLSRRGILVKDGRALEALRNVDTLVFDKTGTLTEEQPTVGAVHALARDARQVLCYAATAELRQPHPIARAILAHATAEGVEPLLIDEACYNVGFGIRVRIDESDVLVGSRRFMELGAVAITSSADAIREASDAVGFSLIYVAVDGQLAGLIELHPTIRPEAQAVIEGLKADGKEVVIISGDSAAATNHLASRLGVERAFAETLPEQKAELVAELRAQGRTVCFVGDGINDAIALRSAHASISLRGASSVATDAAEIVLMGGTLEGLPALFDLVGRFEATMERNLVAAVAPGTIAIGGVFLAHFTLFTNVLLRYAGMVGGVVNTMLPLGELNDLDAEDVHKHQMAAENGVRERRDRALPGALGRRGLFVKRQRLRAWARRLRRVT